MLCLHISEAMGYLYVMKTWLAILPRVEANEPRLTANL